MSASGHKSSLRHYLQRHSHGNLAQRGNATGENAEESSTTGACSEKGLSQRFSDLRTGPSNGSQRRLNSAAAPPSGSPQRLNSASRGAVGNKSQSPGSRSTRSAFAPPGRYRASNAKISKGKAPSADSVPSEIMLHIFSYLGASDLLSCARVCKTWLSYANDNVIWQHLYYKHTADLKPLKEDAGAKPYSKSWKAECIRRCAEQRNKKAISMLKKIHVYTGLPTNTVAALQKTCVRWQLCVIDSDKTEHFLDHQGAFHFTMSTVVRFYSLEAPPIGRLRRLKIYAVNPVFFDKGGQPHPNGPSQRSLLYETGFEWSKLKVTHPADSSDATLNVHLLPGNILLTTWKEDGELAFITVSFHNHKFVQRCLLGESSSVYEPPSHQPLVDDIDPEFGLHSYSCTVELHNQRATYWSQQFKHLHCPKECIGEGYATLIAIRSDVTTDHVPIARKLTLPWKTDLFKNILQDMCFLDVTVLDENSKPMWCISSPVKLSKPEESSFCYDYDGDYYDIQYTDTSGKVHCTLNWMEDRQEYFLTCLEISLSLRTINDWFGTNY